MERVGPYEVIRELARGGMATVYEAKHAMLGRIVALKVLRTEQRVDGAAERMTQEAQILAVLGHTGTADVFDLGVHEDGRMWIAMELVRGESLADRVHRVGRLSVPAVIAIMHDVLDVLHAAHGHAIAHRDIKPENLIIDEHGQVRILDWGIAGIGGGHERQAREEPDAVAGTPHYMAPELVRGGPVDVRSDIYALGCVLYEALTGAPPFTDEDNMQILVKHLTLTPAPVGSRRPDTPDGLSRMIDAMLAKSPTDRPTTEQLRAGIIQLEHALHEFGAGDDAAEHEDPADTGGEIVEIILDLDEIEPLDDEEVILLETPTRPRFATDLGVGRPSLPGMPPAH